MMRPTHLHTLRLSDETVKLIRQAFAATTITLQLSHKDRTTVDAVLNEALQAYIHHQTRALRSVGGSWQMVIDELDAKAMIRGTGESKSQLRSADAGDVVEE